MQLLIQHTDYTLKHTYYTESIKS